MEQLFPHDDQYMVYDKKSHKYYLTEQGVLDELGINLALTLNTYGDASPSTVAERTLKEVSRTLYNFIYSRNPRFKMYLEKLLAKYVPLRDVIFEALKNEILYQFQGGNFSRYSGVNVITGKVIDLSAMRDNRVISKATEDLLSQDLSNGVNLMYGGYYNLPFNMKYREDY